MLRYLIALASGFALGIQQWLVSKQHKHDWTKWEQICYSVEYPLLDKTLQALYQKRTCTTCGYIEQEQL